MKKTTLRSFMLATTVFMATFFSGCNTEEVEFQTPDIAVSPSILNAPNNKVGEVTFDVTTNRPWKIVIPEDATWVVATPTSGTGNGKVTLSMLENTEAPREVDIKVATTTVYATLRLIQPGAYDLTKMYDMTFGTQEGKSGTVEFADMVDWGKSGPSSSTAKFAGNVQFRNTFPSTDYPGASGGQAIYTSNAESYFQINNMNVNSGTATDYYMTFGTTMAQGTTWDNANLLVQVSKDGGATWEAITYKRANLTNGWRLTTTDSFNLDASVLNISVKFTCKLGGMQLRIDDITMYAKGKDITVTQFPVVTTNATLPSEITTTTASLSGTYTYEATTPAIDFLGIAWKETASTGDFTYTDALSNTASPILVSLTDLNDGTDYTYKAYAKIGDKYYFGDTKTFKTMASYTPPTPVAAFSDDFNTITAAFQPYTGAGWMFFSTYTTSDDNWQTGTYTNSTIGVVDKYIQIAAKGGAATEADPTGNATVYAMIPPVNVSTATSKTLIYNYAYYNKAAFGGSKFEVVASTDFRGNFTKATWTVIDDATKVAADPMNIWSLRTVNLATVNSGAYASATTLYIAFRYIGKTDAYRLDDVFFGQATAPIIWSKPSLSPKAKFMEGAPVAAGTTIRVPYKFGAGSPTISVAVSGSGKGTVAVDPVSTALVYDAVEHMVELPITGIPTLGDLVFTVNGTTVTAPDNTITASVSSATEGVVIYSTGFNADQGFPAGTSYNNANPVLQGPAGQQWSTIFGTTSTTVAIDGGQSLQMRWYTKTATTFGNSTTAFTLSRVTKVEFEANCTNGLGVTVEYSTDGTTWIGAQTFDLSSTVAPYKYVLNGGAEVASAKIRFTLSLPTPAPTATSQIIIDNVEIYGKL